MRGSFNPLLSGQYRLRLPATTSIRQVNISAARIIITQVGATKTRIYYPLLNYGRTSDDLLSGNPESQIAVDYTNSSSYTQTKEEYFIQFEKDSANYGGVSKISNWTFEAIIESNDDISANKSYISLFNKTTGLAVAGTELSSGSISPT